MHTQEATENDEDGLDEPKELALDLSDNLVSSRTTGLTTALSAGQRKSGSGGGSSIRVSGGACGGASGGGAAGRNSALISTKFEVVVPEGAGPGDTLYVSLPTGEEVKVVIPPEGAPGSLLTCSALTSQPLR